MDSLNLAARWLGRQHKVSGGETLGQALTDFGWLPLGAGAIWIKIWVEDWLNGS